eukprot:4704092-Pyramimonas_sp.AAC.1
MARGAALACKRGFKRSVLHRCARLGMPDKRLRQSRRKAGRSQPGGRGAKNFLLQLAVARDEPTFEVTESPVVRWAREA